MSSRTIPDRVESAELPDTRGVIRVVLRPYASALPLGCFAFAVGNALTSAHYLHLIPATEKHVLALILLAFVAPLELIPCIMAFLSRDTGGATAMGIFAAAWVVQGLEFLPGGPDVASVAIGIFLLFLAIFLAILVVITFADKPLLGILLTVAMLRSIGAALMQFGMAGPVGVTTAILGLAVTAFALYSGFGFLLEDVKQKSFAMTFRRGETKAAIEGNLQHQLDRALREAGVRDQL
jgi:succinate-acetate transporter protein